MAGYIDFKDQIYDEVKNSCKSMIAVRNKLKSKWQAQTSGNKKINLFKSKKSNIDICAKCKNNIIDGDIEQMIDWIYCDSCKKWYHTKCVYLDKFYTAKAFMYFCFVCVRARFEGVQNFLHHFSEDFLALNESCLNHALEIWSNLDEETKSFISEHEYPDPRPIEAREISPIEVLSLRGIMNPYQNCWMNAVFQTMCGSKLFYLLPNEESCSTDVMKHLRNISSDLMKEIKAPLNFTKDMHELGKLIMLRDQKKNRDQDEAELFLERIIEHCIRNAEDTIEDLDRIEDYFVTKVLHLSRCLNCNEQKISVSQNVVLRIELNGTDLENASVQSLLWEYCTLATSQNTIASCDCKGEKKKKMIFDASFLLYCPAILIIYTDRVNPIKSTLDHLPINVSQSIDVGHMLAANYPNYQAKYDLMACINRHGENAANGHYNCALFTEDGQGVSFDDTSVKVVVTDRFMNSKATRTSTNLLFYVKRELLRPKKDRNNVDETFNFIIDAADKKRVEKVWFGIENLPSQMTQIDISDFRRLSSSKEINGDIIYYFLCNCMNKMEESDISEKNICRILPSFFITDIENNRKCKLLSHLLEDKFLFIVPDVIVAPVDQKSRHHWSIVAIFPRQKLVVHCDSIPDYIQDISVFKKVACFISKYEFYQGGKSELDKWKFLALSSFGLPRQKDSINCGIFACLYGYGVLTMQDVHLESENTINIRYWIANYILEGSQIIPKFKAKDVTLWQNVREQDNVELTVLSNLPDKIKVPHKPFQTLKNLLQQHKISEGDFPQPSPSISSGDSDQENSDVEEEINLDEIESFRTFCTANADRMASKVRMAKKNLSKGSENSERLLAAVTLAQRKFRELAEDECLYMQAAFGHSQYLQFKSDTIQIFSETKNKSLTYVFPDTYGLSAMDLIDKVIFPEMMTWFLMQKKNSSYKEATHAIYNKERKRSIFHNILLEEVSYTSSLSLARMQSF